MPAGGDERDTRQVLGDEFVPLGEHWLKAVEQPREVFGVQAALPGRCVSGDRLGQQPVPERAHLGLVERPWYVHDLSLIHI